MMRKDNLFLIFFILFSCVQLSTALNITMINPTVAGGLYVSTITLGVNADKIYFCSGNYPALSSIQEYDMNTHMVTSLHTLTSSQGCPSSLISPVNDANYLYGASSYQGTFPITDGGWLYRISLNPVAYELIHYFNETSSTDGNQPSSLMLHSSGNLYGVTMYGGSLGGGIVFKVTTGSTPVYSILYSISYLYGPPGYLTEGVNSLLYGNSLASGGIEGCLWKFDVTSSNFTVIHSSVEDDPEGWYPYRSVFQVGQYVYANTQYGDLSPPPYTYPSFFRLNLNTNAVDVISTNGYGNAYYGSNGLFYGIGSSGPYGSIFSYNPITTVVETLNLTSQFSTSGVSNFIQPPSGGLYGFGTSDYGNVFLFAIDAPYSASIQMESSSSSSTGSGSSSNNSQNSASFSGFYIYIFIALLSLLFF